jgi:hypothetical protein
MALTITTLNLLNQYINGVMERADHNGQNVNEIVLTLAGAVIWRATQDVEVRAYNDETGNILWLTINGHRYAIAYNHNTLNIEIKDRNQNGTVLATFNNTNTALDVKNTFSTL